MAATNWKTQFLDSLHERDAREKKLVFVFESYSRLANRVAQLENAKQVSDGFDPGGASSREAASLRAELQNLYDFKTSSAARIDELQVQNEQLQIYNTRILAEYDKARTEKKQIQSRLKIKDEEQRERNRALQVLQDELLTHQIQLNVAEDKIISLEAENKELVKRWMERVSREAEKLNDANAFLERYVFKKNVILFRYV
ncbi:autophagy-related protein 16 [Lipomyces japonicus]|uniref:autophagy-related protein 16 n=1 Tax=Lipomyces japonicus TaxID=56871 RepID=UPI0034CF7B63